MAVGRLWLRWFWEVIAALARCAMGGDVASSGGRQGLVWGLGRLRLREIAVAFACCLDFAARFALSSVARHTHGTASALQSMFLVCVGFLPTSLSRCF